MGALIMAFDLSNYETVEERLEKWWKDNEDGSIQTELVNRPGANPDEFVFVARLYRTTADAIPVATGWASEIRTGSSFNKFACELAESSAIGRALANYIYSKKGARPSRVEMERVANTGQSFTVENKLEDPVQWGETDWTTAVPEAPNPPPECGCAKGMALKKGLSKTTKKPYYGYTCLDNIKEHNIWAKQTSTGAWYFPKDKE
jgi:hypothetical protein